LDARFEAAGYWQLAKGNWLLATGKGEN